MDWMTEEVGRGGNIYIPSKAIKNFTDVFRGDENAIP
jgi:hypothetical protein